MTQIENVCLNLAYGQIYWRNWANGVGELNQLEEINNKKSECDHWEKSIIKKP